MKTTIRIYLIIFSVLLILYLRDSLLYEAFGRIIDVSTYSHYYLLFLTITTVLYAYFIINKSKINYIYPIPIIAKTILSLFLISIFWSLFHPLGSTIIYINLILPLFILNFSYHVIQGLEKLQLFYLLLIFILVVLSIDYFSNYQYLLYLQTDEQVVTNSSYFLLYLLPLYLCCKNKYIVYVSVFIVAIAVFMSAKRGGTIAILLGLLSYIVVNSAMLKSSRYKLLKFMITAISIFIIAYLAFGLLNSVDYYIVTRMYDIANSGGSGRDVVWLKTIDMIESSSMLNMLIGHGFNMVLQDSPIHLSAHNDFLEIQYDFGLFVFIMYILLHIQFIKRIIKMINQGSSYAAPLSCSYAIFFVNSLVAHIFIYTHYLIIFCFVWGIILGLYNQEQSRKISITS